MAHSGQSQHRSTVCRSGLLAPMSGVHEGRDQSGENPHWRACGFPKEGILAATYTNEKPLANI